MSNSRVKRFRNLRFKNKNPRSFIDIKSKAPLTYLHKNQEYYPVIILGLITFFQSLDTYEHSNNVNVLDEEYFKFDLNSVIETIEFQVGIEIKDSKKNLIINEVYMIYNKGMAEFNKFRGEILEFVMVNQEKNKDCNIYHEPILRHKRKPLIQYSFPGSGCLIDILNVHDDGLEIKLIECKATLDNHIKYIKSNGKPLNNKGKNFLNKINYLNVMGNELESYEYANYQKINVVKGLASLKVSKKRLPNQFRDIKIINLVRMFEDEVDNMNLTS